MHYDSITKFEERGAVLALYESVKPKKGILYLEDASSKATQFFLAASVPAFHLFPVNSSMDACVTISKATGVRAIHSTIEQHLTELATLHSETMFSVVWLDLMSRTVTASTMRDALSLSHVVKVTLAVRGSSAKEVSDSFVGVTKSVGGVIHSLPCSYKGASNVMNMVKFTVVKRERDEERPIVHKPSKRSRLFGLNDLVGMTILVPSHEWNSNVPKSYDQVKRKHNGLLFKLTSTYYKTGLVSQAIMKDGSLSKSKERWVLSKDEALRFLHA